MAKVMMYSTASCPFCTRARDLLNRKQVIFQDILIDEQPEKRAEMMERSGRRTVPQIFINDKPIGGCDDLYALESQGQLDELLTR